MSVDDQRRKLDLVVAVADAVGAEWQSEQTLSGPVLDALVATAE